MEKIRESGLKIGPATGVTKYRKFEGKFR